MHPILFRIHDYPIGTYGLMAMLGLAAGLLLFAWLVGRAGHSRLDALEVALWAFMVGLGSSMLTGALVAHHKHPEESFLHQLRYGGIYYVGFVVAITFLLVGFAKIRIPPLKGLDLLVPGLALAHGIGRIGCTLAGCCWGKACDLPWAITFTNPDAGKLTGVPMNVPLHPTQLYEAAAEFIIAAILTWKAVRHPWRRGSTFLGYIALYGTARFIIEFFRADERGTLGKWPTSQPLALASALVAMAILVVMALRRGSASSDSEKGATREAADKGATQQASTPVEASSGTTQAASAGGRSAGRRKKRR